MSRGKGGRTDRQGEPTDPDGERTGGDRSAEPQILAGDRLARVLERAAAADVLLVASDFDGTLSPIVEDPDAARPEPEALGALARLGGLRSTAAAIVSGRSRSDLRHRTGAPAGVLLVGSHGLEWEDGLLLPPERLRSATRARDQLEILARRFEGAEVEPKPAGAAFHYRHVAPDLQAAAVEAVEAGPGRLPHIRILHGKKVVELSAGEGDKGDALRHLRERVGAQLTIFLGDDVTDEHAFAVLEPGDIGVKVGAGATRAGFRLPERADVDRFLGELARLRERAFD